MFFYATSSRFKFNLKVNKYSELNKPEWLPQMAEWVEKQWGYMRRFPGLKKRLEIMDKVKDYFYVITYADQPIGMFALFDSDFSNDKYQSKELTYVYLEESFRGLGIGKEIIKAAKKTSSDMGSDMLVFDTLNPNLNHFYEGCGAKVVCDGAFKVTVKNETGSEKEEILRYPTSCLRM